MQTISCYPLSTYTSIELDKIPLASSIDDLLSPMHLFLHATVRCQTMLELPQSKLFQQEYCQEPLFRSGPRTGLGCAQAPPGHADANPATLALIPRITFFVYIHETMHVHT